MRNVMLLVMMILVIGHAPNTIEFNTDMGPIASIKQSHVLERETSVQIKSDAEEIFTEADLHSEVLDTVYKGSVYRVHNSKTVEDIFWYQIEYNPGKYGWLSGNNVDLVYGDGFEYEEGQYPDLNMPKYILRGDTLVVEKILGGDSEYDLYIEGIIIQDAIILNEVGSYEIYGVSRLNPNKRTITYRIECLQAYYYGLVYDDYSSDARVIGYVRYKSEVADNLLSTYLTNEDGLVVWYEIEINDVKGYVKSRNDGRNIYNKTINAVCNDQVLTLEGDYISFAPSMFLDKYYHIYGDQTVLINPDNGAILYTNRYYYTVDDNRSLIEVNRDEFYMNYNQMYAEVMPFRLRVIDLEKGNFDVLLNYEDECINIDSIYIDDDHDNENYIGLIKISDDPWAFSTDRRMREIYQLQKNNKKWEFKLIHKPKMDYENDSFQVYTTFPDRTTTLGTFTQSDCENIEFMNVYDIIDQTYVLWFELTLKDGRKGYTYRTLRPEEEKAAILGEDAKLVMADKSLYDVKDDANEWISFMELSSGLEAIDTYILTYYDEREYQTLIAKDDLDRSGETFEGKFYEFPNKQWALALFYSREDGYDQQLIFYDLSSGKKEEVFTFDSPSRWIFSLNVVDDETVTFFIRYDNKKLPVIMKNIDGQWQIVSDLEVD